MLLRVRSPNLRSCRTLLPCYVRRDQPPESDVAREYATGVEGPNEGMVGGGSLAIVPPEVLAQNDTVSVLDT